jgi:hypothetical protein
VRLSTSTPAIVSSSLVGLDFRLAKECDRDPDGFVVVVVVVVVAVVVAVVAFVDVVAAAVVVVDVVVFVAVEVFVAFEVFVAVVDVVVVVELGNFGSSVGEDVSLFVVFFSAAFCN